MAVTSHKPLQACEIRAPIDRPMCFPLIQEKNRAAGELGGIRCPCKERCPTTGSCLDHPHTQPHSGGFSMFLHTILGFALAPQHSMVTFSWHPSFAPASTLKGISADCWLAWPSYGLLVPPLPLFHSILLRIQPLSTSSLSLPFPSLPWSHST